MSCGLKTFVSMCTQTFKSTHLERLNAFDLFSNTSNSSVCRRKPAYCNAYCARRGIVVHQPLKRWAHFIQKTWYYTCPAASKDFYFSYALFNFSAARWYLQSLWHYVINGYILSHSAAEKRMHLCGRWVWIIGSMEEYTHSQWLPCHRRMQGNKWKMAQSMLIFMMYRVLNCTFHIWNRGHNHTREFVFFGPKHRG